MTTTHDPLDALVGLSRSLGDPTEDLVILAEGNTSVRVSPDRMLVKATGTSLTTATGDDFVELDLLALHRLIADESAQDDDVTKVFTAATQNGTKRPSVEALLHAVCYELTEAGAVGHTHPTMVNAILCSDRANALVDGSLFPDQIVVLGTNPLLIPYVDPGLELARYVHDALVEHIDATGSAPRVIYLANHGLVALGETLDDVAQITAMAVKAARVLLGVLGVGDPVYLTSTNESRIDSRPDEDLRRAALGRRVS